MGDFTPKNTMDETDYDVLRQNFLAHYNGNRWGARAVACLRTGTQSITPRLTLASACPADPRSVSSTTPAESTSLR